MAIVSDASNWGITHANYRTIIHYHNILGQKVSFFLPSMSSLQPFSDPDFALLTVLILSAPPFISYYKQMF